MSGISALPSEANLRDHALGGGVEMVPQIDRLTRGDGHSRLRPHRFSSQYEHALGGYRIQARGDAAGRVLAGARAVYEVAGAFAVLIGWSGDVAGRAVGLNTGGCHGSSSSTLLGC